jgi:tetratricopeptide (TPR) repeat protein
MIDKRISMLGNDDEEDFYDGGFNEDLNRFEKSLKGGHNEFIDSDKLETIIDHYLAMGQYNKAAQCAERGILFFSFNSVFYLRKAQAISAMGQLKEALYLLTKIEKIESPTCEHFLTKASIFSQLKDSKRAIRYFKEALAISEPEDKDEIFLDLAMEYQMTNDFNEAISVLNQAIKYNQNNEGAIYEIAFCYDQIGDYSKAINCYSSFIDENPYSFTAWYNLGNAYSKLEKFDKAVWAYEYCLLIHEDFSPAYFNIGNAFLSQDEFLLAVQAFEKCIEIDGDDGLAFCYIAECHEQLGNLELSKHYYNRSLELVPEFPEAWLGLGIVHDLEGKTFEGIQFIKKAIDLDPTNSGFYQIIAGAYEKYGDLEECENAFLLSLELDSKNNDALIDYINFLLKKDRISCAWKFITNYPLEEINMTIKLLKFNVLWSQKMREEAISLLNSCIIEDEDLAKDIFEINEDLLNEPKIVNLFSKL